ncbi:Copper-transporting ATPase HMA4 like protein [Verticillium longisporum]|uniref:Copper-transporting ATPase HMA4 like protein n=1 Tax=Verticillium longisporum TaxID=100787 RepID=A0A8I2Z4E4_VERLO|nr:Copper-transporting ATPase HMA4 like protein [Verticillium longisporum]
MDTDPLLPRKKAPTRRAGVHADSAAQYGTVAGQATDDKRVTTSFLLGNLHCPSCVSSIQEALGDACGRDIVWISPNVVTSVVTVEHRDTGPAVAHVIATMAKSLEAAGFEVCSVTTTSAAVDSLDLDNLADHSYQAADDSAETKGAGALGRLLTAPRFKQSLTKRQQTHLANCEECRHSRPHTPRSGSQTPLLTGARARLERSGTSDLATLSTLESITAVGSSSSIDFAGHAWRATYSIGGMTCTSCVRSIEDELKRRPSVAKVVVNLVNNSAIVDVTEKDEAQVLVQVIEDIGYDVSLEEVVPIDQKSIGTKEGSDAVKEPSQWRATLAIGGMTCASCSNAITAELNKLDWISNVAVNLVSNSATVDFTVAGKENDTAEAIEDMGYEATVDSVVAYEAEPEHEGAQERRVQILVEGAYCKHCPDRLVHSLAAFKPNLEIISAPTVENPKMQIAYVPNTPYLTIRRIWAAIEAADPSFRPSIYHPPTIEERSKAVVARHQRQLLRRVYLSLVIAIPTFIIGIVYMNLVSDDDPWKHYLMKPWVSGINRAQIVLFILATPVYFFATDVFHVRAIKELKNLWRRGSRTPILRRFYKFGSMNLLISLGTTIAYVSSICQLVAAGIEKPNFVEDTHFYFDSVVFLTLFLLLGRLIEAYSKAKTGDAVEILGKLRPSTAILVEKDSLGNTIDSTVKVEMIEFGDVVRVQHGASPVADGVIVQGESSFDESRGLAAKHGILAKGGGEAFEKASKIDLVVFDKTGTLTVGGEPKITDALTYPGSTQEAASQEDTELLFAALKAVEENSSHPIAKAIVSYCKSRTEQLASVDNLQEIPGRGMKAICRGQSFDASFDIIVGNESLMSDNHVAMSESTAAQLETWKREAKSVALVATKPISKDTAPWTLAAALSIADPIRPEAVAIVEALRERGTSVWMLSGDNLVTAKAVASQVGIDPNNVLAEVLPSQKAEKITYLQSTMKAHSGSREHTMKRATVAMVGDGINDSPALTRADVGIAIGSGSDVAISSADFVLVSSDLRAVVTLLELSRTVFRRIRLNFAWAIVYNVLALPVAAGCFYPFTTSSGQHIRLDPVWAALAMALSSISVVLSSLALRIRIPWIGFQDGKIGS